MTALAAFLNPITQMQAPRSASQRRRARREVNQRFLSAMLDMGIAADRAELALCETGNVGVEVRVRDLAVGFFRSRGSLVLFILAL